MPRVAASLLALLASCGGAGADTPAARPQSAAPALVLAPVVEPRLRVATFNVNFGLADAPDNLRAVEDLDADVVLLQEVTAASEASYRAVLGERYPHILFRDCCNAGGLAVLSKHPILAEQYLEPDAGWFPAWLVTVQTDIGPVQLLNVHLRPPVSDSGSWVAGQFSTRKIRRQEIEGFWASIDAASPVIVAGDFNENANGRAVTWLGDHGLRSALAQVDAEADTWHWPTRVGELTAMLDHIVYDPRLSLLSAEVRTLGDSDHYPVVADFARAVP